LASGTDYSEKKAKTRAARTAVSKLRDAVAQELLPCKNCSDVNTDKRKLNMTETEKEMVKLIAAIEKTLHEAGEVSNL
jgi:hypothetical protein